MVVGAGRVQAISEITKKLAAFPTKKKKESQGMVHCLPLLYSVSESYVTEKVLASICVSVSLYPRTTFVLSEDFASVIMNSFLHSVYT